MSCYMRHLRSWFDDLDLEYDQPNRKRVDVAAGHWSWGPTHAVQKSGP